MTKSEKGGQKSVPSTSSGCIEVAEDSHSRAVEAEGSIAVEGAGNNCGAAAELRQLYPS